MADVSSTEENPKMAGSTSVPDDLGFECLGVNESSRRYAIDNVFVLVPTAPDGEMAVVDAEMRKLAEAYPGGIAVAVLLDRKSGRLSDEARQDIKERTSTMETQGLLLGTVLVVKPSGFIASMLIAVGSSMMKIRGYPTALVRSHREAAEFLHTTLGAGSPGQSKIEAGLTAVSLLDA